MTPRAKKVIDGFLPAVVGRALFPDLHQKGLVLLPPLDKTDDPLDQSYNKATKTVGSGERASVLMGPVLWIAKQVLTIDVQVYRDERVVAEHPALALVRDRTVFALAIDVTIYGNAWLEIVRGSMGEPVTLRYLSPGWVDPRPTFGNSIEYVRISQPGHAPRDIHVDDLVHIALGVDSTTPSIGMSPLMAALIDAATDVTAARIAADVLRNRGIAGLIVSPKTEKAEFDEKTAEAWQNRIDETYSGASRGKALVTGRAIDVHEDAYRLDRLAMAAVRGISEARVCAIVGVPPAVISFNTGMEQTQVGAPQPLSAALYTPTGETTMGDVKVGDPIATPAGFKPVRAVHPQGVQDIYTITFQDGSQAESTIDHLWHVTYPRPRYPDFDGVVPLSAVAALGPGQLKRCKVPLQGAVPFAEQDVPIDPYLMGLLIGDGSFRTVLQFSNPEHELVEAVRAALPDDFDLVQKMPGSIDHRISYRGARAYSPMKQALRDLGLWMKKSPEKFIPEAYKYNSVAVRTAVLAGILDTDGYVFRGQPYLEQTSARLAADVEWIVQSLGGYVRTKLRKVDATKVHYIAGRPMRHRHDVYRQSIAYADAPSLFRLTRKRDRAYPVQKATTRKFRSIEYSRREEAQCIEVEGGLYITDGFIVTHNTLRHLIGIAWRNAVMPTVRMILAALTDKVLVEFDAGTRFGYKLPPGHVADEDAAILATRSVELYQGGLITRAEGRADAGYPERPGDDVYIADRTTVAASVDSAEPSEAP